MLNVKMTSSCKKKRFLHKFGIIGDLKLVRPNVNLQVSNSTRLLTCWSDARRGAGGYGKQNREDPCSREMYILGTISKDLL